MPFRGILGPEPWDTASGTASQTFVYPLRWPVSTACILISLAPEFITSPWHQALCDEITRQRERMNQVLRIQSKHQRRGLVILNADHRVAHATAQRAHLFVDQPKRQRPFNQILLDLVAELTTLPLYASPTDLTSKGLAMRVD